MNKRPLVPGFTLIEVIVSLAVTSLFVTFFFQMYFTSQAQRIVILKRTTASDIAYKNLRKFQSKPVPAIDSSKCVSAKMDLATPGGAVGEVLGNQDNKTNPSTYKFIAEDTSTLGKNSTQQVTAFAPYGCGNPNFSTLPLKIVSTVTFGSGSGTESMTHVAYVQ